MTERINKKRLVLNQHQRDILIGGLLGDLHAEKNGKYHRVVFTQSQKHKPYLDSLFEIWSDWCGTPPRDRVDVTRNNAITWSFRTFTHAVISVYVLMFYKNKVKRVPHCLWSLLTPRALAYWWMDDGSMKSGDSLEILLNTQSFTKTDIDYLCDVLNHKFGFQAKPREQKDGYQISISGSSYDAFCRCVGPFLEPSMVYKLPKRKPKVKKESNKSA